MTPPANSTDVAVAKNVGPFCGAFRAHDLPSLFDVADVSATDPQHFGELRLAELANTTGLNRETLYRTLSENGNPRLSSLGLIIEALGLRLSIESSENDPRAA
jgi:hypothetical protein